MKRINLIVKHCGECPYSEYDPNYGMSYNSGHDCSHTGKRIATDMGSKITELSTLPIPDWCKLMDADKLYIRKKKIEQIKKRWK